MKFSVLMSIYYKESSGNLSECLDSILLNQTLTPDEIVLVIDGKIGSNLWDVINKYKKIYNNFKIIELSENVGLGKALNIGLEKCTFEIVARMDTDDICREDRFDQQIKFLSEHPEIDILGSNILEFDNDVNNIKSKKVQPTEKKEIIEYSKKRNPLNHPTVIFKKKKVEQAKGYVDMPSFEDYYLWLRMISENCGIANIDDELVYMRVSDGLYERRGGANYLKSILKFRNRCLSDQLITFKDYLIIVPIQIFVAILPVKVRQVFFKKILRK